MKYICVNVDNGDTILQDSTYHLSKNFTVDEMACKDGSDTLLYSHRLMMLIQAIRVIVGPITINSAFRPPAYNKKIGGVIGSYHQYGVAVDMSIPKGYTPDSFYKVVEQVCGTQCSIGVYKSFVHLDIGHVARWDNR